jgi:DNA topoisomerase-3
LLRFDENFKLEVKKTVSATPSIEKKAASDALSCPKCQKGQLKGNTAYGCSGYKSDCDFKSAL